MCLLVENIFLLFFAQHFPVILSLLTVHDLILFGQLSVMRFDDHCYKKWLLFYLYVLKDFYDVYLVAI